MFSESITYPAALLAGVASFFSPCVLPLIPAYFTFITGLSLEQLTQGYQSQFQKRVFFSTLFYVLGFSTVFILLGASASFLGSFVYDSRGIIRISGGVIIILLGIHLTGIIRIPALDFEKRFHMRKKPLRFLGVFLVGMAFGAGWSPCVGPLLGSILIVAGNQDTIWQGVGLLSVYSLGLALPFLIISFFMNYLLDFLKKASTIIRYVNVGAGLLLFAIGVLLITNKLNILIE